MKKDKTQMEKGDNGQKITRKQAIQKAGITALTAASLLFLNTKSASASSTEATGLNSTGRRTRDQE